MSYCPRCGERGEDKFLYLCPHCQSPLYSDRMEFILSRLSIEDGDWLRAFIAEKDEKLAQARSQCRRLWKIVAG